MLADILLNRINCRIVALTEANYKYAGQANLRYMNMNIVLTRRKSKKSAGSTADFKLLFHCCNLPISFEQKIIIINCQSTLD